MRCGGTGSPGDCQCGDCNCTRRPDCDCLSCQGRNTRKAFKRRVQRKLDEIVSATEMDPVPRSLIRGLVREIFTELEVTL